MDAIYRRTAQCDADDYIDYALQLVENKEFQLAFFCHSVRHAKAVAEKLRDRAGDHCSALRLSDGHYEFKFNNNSRILVKVPADCVRGHRLHAVIIDYDIPEDGAKYCLTNYVHDYETR